MSATRDAYRALHWIGLAKAIGRGPRALFRFLFHGRAHRGLARIMRGRP
jgi:hypothetical protein